MTDPTRDAEQAVREAMAKVLDGFGCPSPSDSDGNETWCGGCKNAVIDLITAVRQAERARIRGIVEDASVCVVRDTLDGRISFPLAAPQVKAAILAALSSEGT